MRKTVLFGVLYAAFLVGALATCLFGRAGIASRRVLDSYAVSLRRNLDELKSLNKGLSEELELLRSDRGAVRLLARQLGYVERGERRVLVSSYAPPREAYAVGHVEQGPAESGADGPRLETLYLLPLLALFVAFCVDAARSRHDG